MVPQPVSQMDKQGLQQVHTAQQTHRVHQCGGANRTQMSESNLGLLVLDPWREVVLLHTRQGQVRLRVECSSLPLAACGGKGVSRLAPGGHDTLQCPAEPAAQKHTSGWARCWDQLARGLHS
jgi:hypothetical protein